MSSVSHAVLVTGCSTGIGRATAVLLAQSGKTVYATARREEAIADLRDVGCKTLLLDVTEESSMRSAVDHIVAAEGAVGVLVNNAGYSQSGAVESVSPGELRRQFETNVFGLTRMIQLVLPGMREQRWGHIVNLSSAAANFSFPGAGVYSATKYAVEALSDSLRFEVGGFNIGVTLIQPGMVRSSFGATAAADTPQTQDGPYAALNASVAKMSTEFYETGPVARLVVGPEAVAKAIVAALDARSPKIRVRVGPSAHLFIGLRKLVTDRLWDRFLALQFTQPGKT
ncbi:SDR family NAD(P)-dependent oxidoreductase [Mycobacterium sp.]|uniref:SDR family NAD(P)-dependent oxidoreductase n=1 Tax=Mycobacterium sp. TaxID=1785 RepID=UPI003D0EAA88